MKLIYALKGHIKNIFSTNRLNHGVNNSILFTFDDGLMPETTLEVLARLAEHDVKAIFFVVGKRIENRHDILKSIIDAGHEIGNHSFYHRNDAEPAFIDYLDEVKKCQQLIYSITGKTPRFFRPPKGVLSWKSIVISKILGLKTINWSLDVEDWKCKNIIDADIAANRIIDTIKDNDIILLHDDNKNILHILDRVLPALNKYNMKPNLDRI